MGRRSRENRARKSLQATETWRYRNVVRVVDDYLWRGKDCATVLAEIVNILHAYPPAEKT